MNTSFRNLLAPIVLAALLWQSVFPVWHAGHHVAERAASKPVSYANPVSSDADDADHCVVCQLLARAASPGLFAPVAIALACTPNEIHHRFISDTFHTNPAQISNFQRGPPIIS